MRTLAPLPLLATPALAEEPLSAAEFEAYVGGRTLSSLSGGEPYGIEAYHPGRGVTWAFVGGECQRGEWYAKGPDICFVYEDREDDEQCWRFWREGTGLRAEFTGDGSQAGGGSVLYETTDADIGLVCPGYGV